MKPSIIPPVFFLISIILIVANYFVFTSMNLIIFPYNLIGLFIIFFSFIFTGKAREMFLKFGTSHKFDLPKRLITDGLFSKTRNPMYIGMIMFLAGFSVLFENVGGLFVTVIFALIMDQIYVKYEEKKLEECFGDEYLRYKSSVRRWI